MTENNPQEGYADKVADLVSTAFDNIGEALKQPAGAKRNGLTEKAKLQVAAAQVLSNLNLAHEVRIQTLATLAGLDPAAVKQAGALPQEAYTMAAYALGLIEDEPDQERIEALKRSLMGENDPADADLGDLS